MESKNLTKKRGYILATLTSAKNYFTKIKSNISLGDIESINTRLEAVQSTFEKYFEIQLQIDALGEEKVDDGEEKADEFREKYFEVVSLGKTLISQLLESQPSTSSVSTPPITINTPKSEFKIDLPKLQPFDGNIKNWLTFRDTYKAIVHNDNKYSNIQKFYFLRESLIGDAREIINSIQITDTNYDVAYKCLVERYDNPKMLKTVHIRALLNIETINKESLSDLRRFIDEATKHIRILENLGVPVQQWNEILIVHLSNLLDTNTRREWETKHAQNTETFPTVEELKSFIEQKCHMLEMIPTFQKHYVQFTKPTTKSYNNKNVANKSFHSQLPLSQNKRCFHCSENHPIYKCEKFLKLPALDKLNRVKALKLCQNCLSPGHCISECKSSNCKKCDKRHNTMLHFDHFAPTNTNKINSSNNNFQPSSTSNTSICTKPILQNEPTHSSTAFPIVNVAAQPITNFKSHNILLSTAVVYAYDSSGGQYPCRILLDSGSQSNFITEYMCNLLKLKRRKISIPIIGINQTKSQIKHAVQTKIKSRFNNSMFNLEFLVLNKITNNIPQFKINNIASWQIPETIELADPYFNTPNKIDMLIGAEIFYDLLCKGKIKLSTNLPILHQTTLGWILSGKLPDMSDNTNQIHEYSYIMSHMSINNEYDTLNQNLEKFWDIEKVPEIKHQTLEEQTCEQHFNIHTLRDKTGRFVVKLPFNDSKQNLGESYTGALKRFYMLESKLSKNPEIKTMYNDFVNEYIKLGHMRKINSGQISSPNYFLPHHAILKPSSTTTKLRVVFDASFKTNTNMSLNDTLLVGPIVQNDLISIIMKWRKFPIAITSDIIKMYRQIKVDESDQNYQLILWRNEPRDNIGTYQLTTVTYGTASAPYLATKCLQTLAIKEQNNFELASSSIINDCYVDDIITGCENLQQASLLYNQLKEMLLRGGFQLQKWSTNSTELREQIPIEELEQKSQLDLNQDNTIKTLGIFWNPTQDTFSFKVNFSKTNIISKRTILSEISKIFDPLGLITPIVITAKILMQELWQLKLNWDEPLPHKIQTKWSSFQQQQLHSLNKLNINRHIQTFSNNILELHGFCDSSEAAYGACIYIKSTNKNGQIKINLLCSKSRVAPLKKLTIPRLELCAANLLAELQHNVITIMKLDFHKQYFWSDSQIVLAWISASPSKWKNFVANRVANIQKLSKIEDWHYVQSSQNPADLISRGIHTEEILKSNLWWHGPFFLQSNSELNANNLNTNFDTDIPETKLKISLIVNSFSSSSESFISNYSSFTKLQRVTAYILRFFQNCKIKFNATQEHQSGPLSVAELQNATLKLIKIIQHLSFSQEIESLKLNKPLHSKSQLLSLNPFLDSQNILRVGGRLSNANIPYSQKHQILLPAGHFAEIISTYMHKKYLHCGQQSLLSHIRLTYWPLRAKNLVRKTIHKCIKCYKVQPKPIQQFMGDLPTTRVELTRPFLNTGVDFCGPFNIRPSFKRGTVSIKAYVAIYICFATRAVHIELVGNLSTDSFIGSLKRFISRRGKPSNIFCDNATNFIGAKNEFQNFKKFFNSQQNQIYNSLALDNIKWNFIPPRSPHMGGLWEAAVKSAKAHLKRIMTDALLTYEEFNTILHQVESCLNSRPLSSASTDPNDLNPITPGHFLIGDNLLAVPEPDLTNVKLSHLSRWQLTQQKFQHFWRRWSNDYLHQLQNRPKKFSAKINLQNGALVLIRDENLPPLKWSLGKIEHLHLGKDNIARIATIRTQHGLVKRAVNKLCPLPINE